jgi:hypothetical protein
MSKSQNYQRAREMTQRLGFLLGGRWVGTTAAFWKDRINQVYDSLLQPVIQRHMRTILDVHTFRFDGETPESLRARLIPHMEPDHEYHINFFTGMMTNTVSAVNPIRLASSLAHFYSYRYILNAILNNVGEYFIETDYVDCQLQRVVRENPALANQRQSPDGLNCAVRVVLKHLEHPKNSLTIQAKHRIKNVKNVNKKYFKTGINDEGLQELANKSHYTLVVKDRIGFTWREFKPKGKDRKQKKLLLVAHNSHIEEEDEGDTSDGEDIFSDDEDDTQAEQGLSGIVVPELLNLSKPRGKDQELIWSTTSSNVIAKALEYEKEAQDEGTPIISKGELVAYITPTTIYKTQFHEWETYPDCFTAGGVGKEKFLQQQPQYKYGINDSDPFYSLLMDSDRSGFYMLMGEDPPLTPQNRRSAQAGSTEGRTLSVKYDQNKSYKSFKTSGLFQGFPMIEALFKIDKPFSLFYQAQAEAGCSRQGLLYVEWETLTIDSLKSKKPIYYETSGWYPFEIVQKYFEKYGINPLIKSWAYASKSFDVDFSGFTNDQFRTFIGKCISKSYDEVWRTKDFLEFMRARYVLQDRVRRLTKDGNSYQIEYVSDKKPWNMPVVSSYVKAHQKYNMFEKINLLLKNDIIPMAVNVDGIEIEGQRDDLFDIGTEVGQWKHEATRVRRAQAEPMVIKRTIPEPRTTNALEFSKEYIIPRFLHISGAGGNGKTEYIMKLAKVYPRMLFMAPTHEAIKNLIDRGEQMDTPVIAETYHKVFGFGCRDMFPRDAYTYFVLDECSMLSAENLKIMISKLKPHQSLILAGDFWQLPCISSSSDGTQTTPIYDNWTGEKSEEYEKFEIRELTQNWRQKEDANFFGLCQKLRGKLTKSEAEAVLKTLNSRVVPKVSLPENSTMDDIHICGINEQVRAVNHGYTLTEGCKVICNIKCQDLEKNTVPNGAIGIIETMKPFKIRWGQGKTSTFKGVGKNNSGNPRFTPAYGLTIHKAQGKTIKRNVIINPSRLFAKNHLYVALTRATKFSSVYFTEPMTFETFRRTVFVREDSRTSGGNRQPELRKVSRERRMVKTYIKEEPKLTVRFLENMRKNQDNKCCYCGVDMCSAYGEPQSITLERINDSKPHILSNIKLCCFACNSAHRK